MKILYGYKDFCIFWHCKSHPCELQFQWEKYKGGGGRSGLFSTLLSRSFSLLLVYFWKAVLVLDSCLWKRVFLYGQAEFSMILRHKKYRYQLYWLSISYIDAKKIIIDTEQWRHFAFDGKRVDGESFT